jgi:hypothetical protein
MPERSHWGAGQPGSTPGYAPSLAPTNKIRARLSAGMGEMGAEARAANRIFHENETEEHSPAPPHVITILDVTRGLGLTNADEQKVQKLVEDQNAEFFPTTQTHRIFLARTSALTTLRSWKHIPADTRAEVMRRAVQFWKRRSTTGYDKEPTVRSRVAKSDGAAGSDISPTERTLEAGLKKKKKSKAPSPARKMTSPSRHARARHPANMEQAPTWKPGGSSQAHQVTFPHPETLPKRALGASQIRNEKSLDAIFSTAERMLKAAFQPAATPAAAPASPASGGAAPSGSHKYSSRKPDGHGGWLYKYPGDPKWRAGKGSEAGTTVAPISPKNQAVLARGAHQNGFKPTIEAHQDGGEVHHFAEGVSAHMHPEQSEDYHLSEWVRAKHKFKELSSSKKGKGKGKGKAEPASEDDMKLAHAHREMANAHAKMANQKKAARLESETAPPAGIPGVNHPTTAPGTPASPDPMAQGQAPAPQAAPQAAQAEEPPSASMGPPRAQQAPQAGAQAPQGRVPGQPPPIPPGARKPPPGAAGAVQQAPGQQPQPGAAGPPQAAGAPPGAQSPVPPGAGARQSGGQANQNAMQAGNAPGAGPSPLQGQLQPQQGQPQPGAPQGQQPGTPGDRQRHIPMHPEVQQMQSHLQRATKVMSDMAAAHAHVQNVTKQMQQTKRDGSIPKALKKRLLAQHEAEIAAAKHDISKLEVHHDESMKELKEYQKKIKNHGPIFRAFMKLMGGLKKLGGKAVGAIGSGAVTGLETIGRGVAAGGKAIGQGAAKGAKAISETAKEMGKTKPGQVAMRPGMLALSWSPDLVKSEYWTAAIRIGQKAILEMQATEKLRKGQSCEVAKALIVPNPSARFHPLMKGIAKDALLVVTPPSTRMRSLEWD